MMNHARELMDSDNVTLSNIGYVLWRTDGQLASEQLDSICKTLLELSAKGLSEESLYDSYQAGYLQGYNEGFEAGKDAGKSEENLETIQEITSILNRVRPSK